MNEDKPSPDSGRKKKYKHTEQIKEPRTCTRTRDATPHMKCPTYG